MRHGLKDSGSRPLAVHANLPASLCLAIATCAPAQAQQFEPRPGLEALASGATGVFEIGAVDIDRVEAVLRALVHNGQILQVHSKRAGNWLAKRDGSVGGKTIAPTALDQLAVIAGVLDTDVRCRPAAIREEFARAAGIVMMTDLTACPPADTARRGLRAIKPSGAHDELPTRKTDCDANGCRVLHRNATAPTIAFTIELERAQATWRFEGYGIVAIWGIPEY